MKFMKFMHLPLFLRRIILNLRRYSVKVGDVWTGETRMTFTDAMKIVCRAPKSKRVEIWDCKYWHVAFTKEPTR